MQRHVLSRLLLLAMLLAPLPSFSEEMLTSVTQVTDVTQKDPCFTALQSLIERWGLTDLTVNKQFRPTQPISPSEVTSLVGQVRNQISNLCQSCQIPARLVPEFQAKQAACPSPASEAAVVQYLRSALGAKLANISPQTVPLTRAAFISHLNSAIDESYFKINELSSDTAILDDLRQRVKTLGPAQSSKALQLFSEIEAGRGDYGTPTQQKKLASSPSFGYIKAELYLQSGQAAKADAVFQAEFDASLQMASASIDKAKELRGSNPKQAAREISKAKTQIALARATDARRQALYSQTGRPISSPNLANFAKLAELEALVK